MARGKGRPRNGKRKHKHNEYRPKTKKGKFNYREASYVKERKFKNEEIENRRRMIEEKSARQTTLDTDSEDELEDNMNTLLGTFSMTNEFKKRAAESSSEDEDSDIIDDTQTRACNDIELKADSQFTDNESDSSNHSLNEEIIIKANEENEEDLQTAEEDAGRIKDPFSIHLRYDLDDELYEVVSNVPQTVEISKLSWPLFGNIICQIPKRTENLNTSLLKSSTVSILEKKQFAKCGTLPSLITTVDWNVLHVKSQIQQNLAAANHENIKDNAVTNADVLTPLQKELFSVINNYQDLYYPEWSFSNADQIKFVYCLHAINHALKTRTKILHHNAKITKSKLSDLSDIPDEYKDQGLIRPKTLIIVPFRHSCLKIVELFIKILIGEDKGGSVINKKRFMEDFSGSELALSKRNPKPEDYEQTFKGNIDDTFKIGIAITKKTLKLYTEFYKSDIIISSILGLRMLVGAENEAERDYDFLASIELLIIDQAELFLMQNWDHVIHVLNHLHLQPKESHGTDFSRVRSWCINGWAKYYRQTLIFSNGQLPEIHAIFNKKCFNYAGKLKVVNPISVGSICQIVVQVPLIFHRFEAPNHSVALQSRMEFFISKILPQYQDSIMNHTLIFIPSYFDFVKLRNYFNKEEYSFVQICEYSKDPKIARARDMFFHSDAHYLLYSERFHFFRRIRVKGIRHIIFYAPPTFPHFYSEMCNLMQEANQNSKAGSQSNMTVTTLYCKYDILHLSAIIGTDRASKIVTSEKSVHMLVTGE